MREGVTGPVVIDGARGEGGGQILRTSLALSMITGRPLEMRQIRAGRAKPGLRRQHVACVQAAAQLCGATVRGDEVGSGSLDFSPGPIRGGELTIDIGSAGSTTLVVQTVLVPAIVANQPLVLTVHGGTHNPLAPIFEFLDRVFAPHLRAMGADITLTLDRHGFASGGARQPSHDELTKHHGQLTVRIGQVPQGGLRPIDVIEAGPVTRRHATVILARLPTHVGARELAIVETRLGFAPTDCEVREVREGGPANVVMLEVERASGARELVAEHGERSVRAELVAERACEAMQAYLDADVLVGEHLADQLLLPLAVAGGGRFRAAPLSEHATTNIETIQHFLDVPIAVEPDGAAIVVRVG